MKRHSQQSFSFMTPSRLTHGGELSQKKRKTERPLKINKPVHLVLRAKRSGLKTKERKIQELIKKYGDKFQVKIYQTSVNSNHLHFAVSFSRRVHFQNFLRSITGLIAKLMGGKLWQYLAFTRILSTWGKEYKILLAYIHQNQLEASGEISYRHRSSSS